MLAAGITISALVTFAAFGGIGYASSAAKSFANNMSSNQNQGNNQSGDQDETSAGVQYKHKTTICHHTSSTTNPWVVITVSNNALHAHKKHGDTLVGPGGSCPGPPIP